MKEKFWYKNAVIYQLNVKCFRDSNGDGIGDFIGLRQKLDYIQRLGCTAIWLQPFYPSPLRDDGYDIASYEDIHPDYGTLKDFRSFLKEAHRRKLKVITELVINHTSDQHQWFQRARRSKPRSRWRNFYVWSDTPDKFSETRIIFKDFETSNWSWDPVANAYYWHRFYSHQPDLNYDSSIVQKEILKTVDFWMDMGVDGLRLDAIPYLYEREGTDCENLPETHQFLKKLRHHVDSKYSNRMLLAEANQWPDQACAYFGDDDECHMIFNFPVMPRLFMALRMEDRFPIIDITEQTPNPPPSGQWATFLRNHDELTLEMVTDEERDYMYRAYAKDPRARINLGIRRRLAPLLENDRARIELLNVLLLSLPGSPIIYYGDEIGMGDNYYLGDRNGVRTPMQWSSERNAGFSEANPQQLYLPLIIDPEYHHAYLNVANQERTVTSLLWWMRMLITVRQRSQAFGQGSLVFLHPTNPKVLAFIREYEQERILVVINLSRNSQYVELNLTPYAGSVPIDLFSSNPFAKINEGPYSLTLGGYGYYWLSLGSVPEMELPQVVFTEDFHEFIKKDEHMGILKKIVAPYLLRSRWYRSKTRKIQHIKLFDHIQLDGHQLLIIQVHYTDQTSEPYLLPVIDLSLDASAAILKKHPEALIARFKHGENETAWIDAIYDPLFHEKLFDLIINRKTLKGRNGKIIASASRGLKKRLANQPMPLKSYLLSEEQSNNSINYQDSVFLKLYRRPDEGINPDLELVRYLTEVQRFPYVPAYQGALEWQGDSKEKWTLALVQEFVSNGGNVWSLTLDALRRYFADVLSNPIPNLDIPNFFSIQDVNKEVGEKISWMYLEMVAMLGKRTAEMHLALANAKDNKEMAPEMFNPFYQKGLYQAVRGRLRQVFALLSGQTLKLSASAKILSEKVLSNEKEIMSCYKRLLNEKFSVLKMRIHGDFHLGQLLYTGKELMIIDFEGEQAPIGERKLKRSALQDVAGMIRSFHYAVVNGVNQQLQVSVDNRKTLERYADLWYAYVSSVYLNSYLAALDGQNLAVVPKNSASIRGLLEIYLLNKAVYEIGYELQNRPDWIEIPLEGVLKIIGECS